MSWGFREKQDSYQTNPRAPPPIDFTLTLAPHPPPPSPGVCLRSRLWSSSWLRSTRTPYTAQTAFRVVQWLVKIGYPVGEPLPLNRADRVVCFLFERRSKTILSTQCHCKNSHFEVRGPLRHLHMCKKKMQNVIAGLVN